MKPIKHISSPAVCAALLVCAPVLADGHAKDEAYVRDAMRKMDVAFRGRDSNGYLRFLRPDYTEVNKAGMVTTHSKAEAGAQMRLAFTHATSITVPPTTVTRFVFDKRGATVFGSGSLDVTATVNGQQSVFHESGTYRDLWIKTGAGWLKKTSTTVSSTTTVNGKPEAGSR